MSETGREMTRDEINSRAADYNRLRQMAARRQAERMTGSYTKDSARKDCVDGCRRIMRRHLARFEDCGYEVKFDAVGNVVAVLI
jgi:hypothetical protein